MNKYDRVHLQRLSSYQRQVDALYRAAIKAAAQEAAKLGHLSPSVPFSLSDSPITRQKIETLLKTLRGGLSGVLVNGIRSEWTLANNKNNELCRQVFGRNVGRLSQSQYRRYFSTNGAARDAFLARRDAGMNLSDRVWNYTSQFKAEMETVLDLGIRNGMSAEEMQRSLQQYLRHPDNFFRRFRFKEGVDEDGNPLYGRKWKKREWDEANQRYTWRDVDLADYSYGRGVYRSSYKNARRLAVTETNIAYRTSDHLRWQQMDFVVGIRIECSATNHTNPDICDLLAGDYPKDFKWTGWHPHCRCHATSILKTEEELIEDNRRIMQGEEPVEGSVNSVSNVPSNFTGWLADHEDILQGGRSVPYFYTDNPRYTGVTPRMTGANGYTGTKLGRQATKQAYEEYADSKPPVLSEPQRANINEIADALGTTAKPMTFYEADEGRANPSYHKGRGWQDNCQSAVLVHEARLRGLDVTALEYQYRQGAQFDLGENSAMGWLNAKGKTPNLTTIEAATQKDVVAAIEKQMLPKGRYHVGMNFVDGRGHIITAERLANGKLIYFDPQDGTFVNIGEYAPQVESFELLRVDKLLFDKDVLQAICRLV